MYYKKTKKFKKNFDYSKWMEEIEKFKDEINKIEQDYNYKYSIKVNKFGNSIYFEKDNIKYRISTHNKIETKVSTDKDLWKMENQNNIITNSRKNIIKHLINVLQK